MVSLEVRMVSLVARMAKIEARMALVLETPTLPTKILPPCLTPPTPTSAPAAPWRPASACAPATPPPSTAAASRDVLTDVTGSQGMDRVVSLEVKIISSGDRMGARMVSLEVKMARMVSLEVRMDRMVSLEARMDSMTSRVATGPVVRKVKMKLKLCKPDDTYSYIILHLLSYNFVFYILSLLQYNSLKLLSYHYMFFPNKIVCAIVYLHIFNLFGPRQ